MGILDFIWPKQLYKIKDNGNTLSIVEYGDERLFKFNGITYSKLSKKSLFTHSYWDCFIPCAYVFAKPRILLIGLGGGTTAYQLETLLGDSASIDIVENSRKTVELANHFVPKQLKSRVIIDDGADYVRSIRGRYDLIILDAYYSNKIPDQFLQTDFLSNAQNALTGSGILAVNFAMTFMGSLAYTSYVSKLKRRFIVYKTTITPLDGNAILVCSKRLFKDEILKRIKERMTLNDENEFLLRNYERLPAV